ncbi:MAG: hypothetical protein QOJ43_1135 [Gaiellaceae bacterium]|jgi:hypothetical protein|nr:hypothetical protein [Gaiellaceae bacterium]
MEKVSPQVRLIAIVLVLVGAAGMLALRMVGPSAEVDATPIQTPVVHKAKPQPAKAAAPAVKPKPAKVATTAVKAVTRKPALNAPKVKVPPTGFPLAVDRALGEHEIVVVSLVVPGARVDRLAAAEAQAGAKLGGVGYLALNVLNEKVAHALLTKLDRVEDPSVLVVNRAGEIALQLNGFVDRETVAQAAANASS